MKYKYLHSSDWHFGAGRRLTPKSLDYLHRHKRGIESVLKMALKEKVDFILVSGDIFENASTTIEELLAAYELFQMAGEIAPTVVTAGNHDELQVGEFQTKWMQLLSIPNVHFIDTPSIVTVPHKNGTTIISAIPWTGIKDQDEFDQLLSSWSNDSKGQPVDIMMLHECFVGITLDSGLTAKGGVKIPYIPTVKYYACGDIHKHQKVQLPNAYYSGAPMQYNFGDQLPKGCIIVEVNEEDIHQPRFIEIPSAIELHNITSLDQIPESSPHWYKLRCDAASIPKHLPPNIKVVEPVARKIDLPHLVTSETEEEEETSAKIQTVVDFTEGVSELLLENGFSPEEVSESLEEVKRQAIL